MIAVSNVAFMALPKCCFLISLEIEGVFYCESLKEMLLGVAIDETHCIQFLIDRKYILIHSISAIKSSIFQPFATNTIS